MSFSLFEEQIPPPSLTQRVSRNTAPTLRYWLGLDSHVYSLAISASVLFGFFPFMVLILSISENVLGWSGAERAIYVGLRGFLPQDPGLVAFVERNLRAAVQMRGAEVEVVSVILLIFSSNGIFMPLEVAQNRLWGFERNRSYIVNQLAAFGFTVVCGLLALSAALGAATYSETVQRMLGGVVPMPDGAVLAALKMIEAPFMTVILVLVYWLLPNGPVPFRRAFFTAAIVAVLLELCQLIYSFLWPWLDLRTEYGPFFISVTLLLWGFLAAMLVLAGAEICSRAVDTVES